MHCICISACYSIRDVCDLTTIGSLIRSFVEVAIKLQDAVSIFMNKKKLFGI